jgi:hypothetical protein
MENRDEKCNSDCTEQTGRQGKLVNALSIPLLNVASAVCAFNDNLAAISTWPRLSSPLPRPPIQVGYALPP